MMQVMQLDHHGPFHKVQDTYNNDAKAPDQRWNHTKDDRGPFAVKPYLAVRSMRPPAKECTCRLAKPNPKPPRTPRPG